MAVLNFWEGNIIAYVPPAEAIEAVNIVTASFDAEQGQAGGSVVNVAIKSGGNTLGCVAWPVKMRKALALIVKCAGVRSAQACAVAGSGIAFPAENQHFWELTRRAHMDAVVLRLGRLFDPHPTAISLGNLLRTMKENAVAPSTPLPACHY